MRDTAWLALAVLLTGCGNKGDLELPEIDDRAGRDGMPVAVPTADDATSPADERSDGDAGSDRSASGGANAGEGTANSGQDTRDPS